MTPRKTQILRISAIALFLGGVSSVAIGLLSNPDIPLRKISELDKEKDVNSTVYLKGKVVKKIPFLSSRAYELQDATGSILVVTTNDFPLLKKEISIKGKLEYKSIPLAGRDEGELYVKEQERL